MSLRTSKPSMSLFDQNIPYLERIGRKVPVASTKTALVTAALVPIWAVTVLPLTILYQGVNFIFLKPLQTTSREDFLPPLDSGHHVDPATVVPRADRKYDVIVLGATGFTGKLAARHLALQYGVDNTVKWAIAGRSLTKCKAVLQELAEELQNPDILNVDTIEVDVTVPSTLPALVEQTRVVATTAGPYTYHGNTVVEFCAKYGTHYCDITGEVDWVKAMLVKWQETAAQTGAKLVSFCGHDSIPWDLTVMKLQQALKEECQDDLQTVTMWDEMVGGAPGGTLATFFANLDGKAIQAPVADFDPMLRLPDGSKSPFVARADLSWTVAPSTSPWETNKESGARRYTMPFVMAPVNAKVVRWSHALRQAGAHSLVYRESCLCGDWKTAFVSYTGLIMFGSMLLNPVTRGWLSRFGGLPQPGQGPSMKNMQDKHYLCVSAEGIGAAGNRCESTIYFPKDAGCLETSRMLVESALCLALQEENLPVQPGGFWSPSTALGQVLLDRLVATGTHFESRVIPVEAAMRSKL